jgi:hypothetical protein
MIDSIGTPQMVTCRLPDSNTRLIPPLHSNDRR